MADGERGVAESRGTQVWLFGGLPRTRSLPQHALLARVSRAIRTEGGKTRGPESLSGEQGCHQISWTPPERECRTVPYEAARDCGERSRSRGSKAERKPAFGRVSRSDKTLVFRYNTPLGYDVVMRGYEINKDDYLRRLARIEGQVRGLQRMIDEDKYCIDVLTQVNSVSAALKGVAVGLLDEHVRHCVREAAEAGDERSADEMVTEATKAIERLVRS